MSTSEIANERDAQMTEVDLAGDGVLDQALEADYVVIGGGTAGSVVVRRLIDAGYSVIVLEAGKLRSGEGCSVSPVGRRWAGAPS